MSVPALKLDHKTADRAWRLTLMMVGVLTVARLAALFATPLELYPDEAQYWLWSRTLAFGYFSKPPMIAWLIWLTTHIGGDGEAWVRLSAPLLHGAQRRGPQTRIHRELTKSLYHLPFPSWCRPDFESPRHVGFEPAFGIVFM